MDKPIIVDADESDYERYRRRVREIAEEIDCDRARIELEEQMFRDRFEEEEAERMAYMRRKYGQS